MFNHCPKCASTNIEFIGKRYFKCPDCGFLYFHNVASGVGGLIVCAGEILLSVRGKDPYKGLLDVPGGFVDPDESLEQALSREVREETGLEINAWAYLISCGNTYPYADVVYKTTDVFFMAELTGKPALQKQAEEITDLIWRRPEDINPAEIAFPSARQAILAARNRAS